MLRYVQFAHALHLSRSLFPPLFCTFMSASARCHHIFVNTVLLQSNSLSRSDSRLWLMLWSRLFGCTLHFIYLCTLIWLHWHSAFELSLIVFHDFFAWYTISLAMPACSIIHRIKYSSTTTSFIRCRHNINIFEWRYKHAVFIDLSLFSYLRFPLFRCFYHSNTPNS